MDSNNPTAKLIRAARQCVPFPLKLHELLDDAESQGFTDIVSWHPDGTSFKVHDTERFASSILRRYFSQTKFKSFQRQLNLYGFTRIHLGCLKGGYAHQMFIRGRHDLIAGIERQQTYVPKGMQKGRKETPTGRTNNGTRTDGMSSDHGIDPLRCDEYAPSALFGQADELAEAILGPDRAAQTNMAYFHGRPSSCSSNACLHQKLLFDYHQSVVGTGGNGPGVTQDGQLFFDQVVQPTTMLDAVTDSAISGGDAAIDAAIIADLCTLEYDPNVNLPPLPPAQPTNTQSVQSSPLDQATALAATTTKHSFPWKLHCLLADAEREGLTHVVSWDENGTFFKVHDTDAFVNRIMGNYFNQTKYESFRRQLNLYGFVRVPCGARRGFYRHELFVRSDRSLCSGIQRDSPGKPSASRTK